MGFAKGKPKKTDPRPSLVRFSAEGKKECHVSLAIVGGGPAGLCAASAAYDAGVRDLVLIERDDALGGILQQCIHSGFGVHRFGEELTGPEYAERCENEVRERRLPCLLSTMVLSLSSDRVLRVSNEVSGVFSIRADAVILATGCRERPRGALTIPGTRPSGVFTAGTAQKLINRMGVLPGKEVVILGSGDIGLIMARRMTLEGAKVRAVLELLPYSGGLARNIQQCLHDFDIPLYLSHTVTGIHGEERLTGVTVAKVDENRRPIPGSEWEIPCDTLLLSVGLIPENELARGAGIVLDRATGGAVVDSFRQTSVPGIFACGNALHVHDLADYVSSEAETAGRCAASYLRGTLQGSQKKRILLTAGNGVRYTVPQILSGEDEETVWFRVSNPMRPVTFTLSDGEGHVLMTQKAVKAAPGEMQTFRLPHDRIPDGADRLILSAAETDNK